MKIQAQALLNSLIPLTGLTILILSLTGCLATKHEVKTEHEIKPIYITLDVNLKIDRELDDFFSDLDEDSDLINYDKN